MNRKKTIIFCVISITIILLLLIRVTYGYYITKINSNNNSKSVYVNSAKLELTYSDDDNIITNKKFEPGIILSNKTFTVQNNGNAEVKKYNIGLINLKNTFTRTDDIVYTLTCKSNIENKNCNSLSETTFPNENSIVLNNQIDENEIQTYTLKIQYKEMKEDQSSDMGAQISGKIDIFATDTLTIEGNVTNHNENDYVVINSKEQTSEIKDGKYKFVGIEPDSHTVTIKNRNNTITKKTTLKVEKGDDASIINDKIIYSEEKNVANIDINISNSNLTLNPNKISEGKIYLKDRIIANAKKNDNNKSSYQKTPLTIPAEEISTNTEKTLSVTKDEYGDSYYFRGNVTDNYVDYANMCWRIVRIEGNGVIKLVLEDQDDLCATSNGNWNISAFILDEERNYGIFGIKYYTENSIFDDNGHSNSGERWIMDYLTGYVTYDLSASDAFKYFQKNKLSGYVNKLESGHWCLADKAYANVNDNSHALTENEKTNNIVNKVTFFYDTNVRHFGKSKKEPTLKCNGTIMNEFADQTDMYVGTLTADEVVYAGGKIYDINSNFYLINDYQKSNSLNYWTLTPIDYSGYTDSVFSVKSNGVIDYYEVNSKNSFRPAIRLKSNTVFVSGDGTKDNAYVIN